ncbi:hypothetical protein PanWU01x14_361160 [Parasponia andersonii]|uniref:Uncharacterized protein n=1 Tax=Parasponia andersonii TaxID=3476 RepID=A0A2P5A7D5_PARAD|nr:hypothetical protein PanWU01x14_361160 [Parasponia andersonii]
MEFEGGKSGSFAKERAKRRGKQHIIPSSFTKHQDITENLNILYTYKTKNKSLCAYIRSAKGPSTRSDNFHGSSVAPKPSNRVDYSNILVLCSF